jgi:cytochrome c
MGGSAVDASSTSLNGREVMKVKVVAWGAGCLLVLGTAAANAALDDAKAQQLMKTGGCAACHSVDKKLVGPAYKDVAAKHKGEADAVSRLEKAVRTGSNNVYGKIPMPPTPPSRLGDAELHSLLEWVMSK